MLSAHIEGFGWPSLSDIASGASQVASSVTGVVSSAAGVANKAIQSGVAAVAPICGLASNPLVQVGITAAGGPGVTAGVKTGCAIVSAAGAKPTTTATKPTATTVRPTGTSVQRTTFTVMPRAGTFTPPTAAGRYKGGIAWRSSKTGKFVIAMPRGMGDFGLAPFQVVAQEAANPEGASIVSEPEGESATGTGKPFYKNPLVIGGAVLALVAGGYFVMRKR